MGFLDTECGGVELQAKPSAASHDEGLPAHHTRASRDPRRSTSAHTARGPGVFRCRLKGASGPPCPARPPGRGSRGAGHDTVGNGLMLQTSEPALCAMGWPGHEGGRLCAGPAPTASQLNPHTWTLGDPVNISSRGRHRHCRTGAWSEGCGHGVPGPAARGSPAPHHAARGQLLGPEHQPCVHQLLFTAQATPEWTQNQPKPWLRPPRGYRRLG